MQKILRCYRNNAIKPKIIVSDNAFKIILPNINYRSESLEATSSCKDMIIKLLSEQETVTRKETETLLNVSQATAARVLKKMVESGLIVAIGSGKNLEYKKKRDAVVIQSFIVIAFPCNFSTLVEHAAVNRRVAWFI